MTWNILKWERKYQKRALCFFLVFGAVAAAIAVYFEYFRYEDADIVDSTQVSTLPEVIDFAVIETSGFNAVVYLQEQRNFETGEQHYTVAIEFKSSSDSNSKVERGSLRGLRMLDETADEIDTLCVSSEKFSESETYDSLRSDGSATSFILQDGPTGSYVFELQDQNIVGVALVSSRENTNTAFIVAFEGSVDIPQSKTIASSEPSSSDYPTSGTILMWQRYELDMSTLEFLPYTSFEFVDIDPPSAPGALLYLTPSETSRGVGGNAIPLEIEGTRDGYYTKRGSFEMRAPSNINREDMYYKRIIIWCEPFGVFLGDGDIDYI